MSQLFERVIRRGNFKFGYLDGNCWFKIFHQKYDINDLFTNEDEAKYIISTNKYSLLANITDDYKIDNAFHLLIYYPESNVYFRWEQSIFPLYDIEGQASEAQ